MENSFVYQIRVSKYESDYRIPSRHLCADVTDIASSLLLETGLFNGLKHRQLPKKFLKDLIKYSKAHPGSMIIKKFDMKTDTEIPYEE